MGILRTNTVSGLETPTPVTGSVVFDGNGDYLQVADSEDFTMATGNYTIEGWFYFNVLNSVQRLYGQRESDTSQLQFLLETSSSGVLSYYFSISNTTYQVQGNTLTTDKWYHIAVVRNGDIHTLYVDGVSVATRNQSGSLDNRAQPFSIGRQGNYTPETFNGYISNLRILKGTALYTSNFTPPTRELQSIGDTVLLCCNNPDSAGAEATGKTITVNGNAAASTFSPGLVRDFTFGTQFDGVSKFDTQGYFVPPSGNTQNRYTLGLDEIVTSGLVLHLDAGNPFSYPATGVGTKWTDLSGNNNHGTLVNGVSYTENNRGALVFDGTNDYATVPDISGVTDFTILNNYTVDFWVYLNSIQNDLTSSDNDIIEKWSGTEGYPYTFRYFRSTQQIYATAYNGVTSNSTTIQISPDNWWHICGVFNWSNSVLTLYANGGQNSSSTALNLAGNIQNASNLNLMRRGNNLNYATGKLPSLKIYNRALTATEVLQNYEALKGRYGLP